MPRPAAAATVIPPDPVAARTRLPRAQRLHPIGRFALVETGVLLRIGAVVAFSAACLAYCTPAARGITWAIMALTQSLQDTLEDLWDGPTIP